MQAIILAAGKGTRMKDDSLPKVMFPLLGKPLIHYPVENLTRAGVKELLIVVGYQKEKVVSYLGKKAEYVLQEQQLGTGHAVMVARDQIKDSGGVIVCCGDMPLFLPQTIKQLVETYHKHHPVIAMLTVFFKEPQSYGRIVRDAHGKVTGIVEQKDCNPEQLKIKECNPGFYIFDSAWLKENIVKLGTNNAQKEYYLTDLVEMAIQQHRQVLTVPVSEESEALGINTPEQLKEAERILLARN